jgi:hypothetical protein
VSLDDIIKESEDEIEHLHISNPTEDRVNKVGKKTTGKFICKKCKPKIFFDRTRDLSVHDMSVHLKLKPFICEYEGCDHCCSTKGNLTKHVSNVHLKLKIHKCLNYPDCDAAFAYKRDLNFHIEAKHLNIIYTCDFCETTFTFKKNLRTHVKEYHVN